MTISFQTSPLNGHQARYTQLSESGIEALFYPANGFPIGSYHQLLKRLSTKYKLTGLSLRACWPDIGSPPTQPNWEIYAQDLIAFIEQHYDQPVVGIGHSQGATGNIMAAAQRPDLFSKLILIEPANVSPLLETFFRVTPLSIKRRYDPLKSAFAKSEFWESRDAFFEANRKVNAFRRIRDEVMQDFANYGLEEIGEGRFKMVFPPLWEASNYARPRSVLKYLKKIELPVQVIAGKPSLFFTEKMRAKWKKLLPQATFSVEDAYGHLFPLESPEICAEMILNRKFLT